MAKVNIYLALISCVVIGFYSVTAVYFPQLYIFATYEDLYGEWAQFFFFFCTFFFSLLNALERKNNQYRWFFALLACASFYTFMEEISWGQRLLDFVSPEFFAENSYQDEVNLHNLLTGPVDSWTKTALTYLISIGVIIYGALFPILLKIKYKPALYLANKGLVAPPLALLPAFVAAAISEMEFFSFNEAEVAELLLAMAMAFTALEFYLRKKLFFVKKIIIFILLTVLPLGMAYGVTTVLLTLPTQQAEIKSRLANGYKKFADRYKGYAHYAAVVEVLQFYDELRPNNTVILRRIAKNYQLLGKIDKHDEYIEKAIQIALQRYQNNPEKVPTLISLAKSYHKIHQPEKVSIYAQKAYDIASSKVTNSPETSLAYWYYWLAKSCEQLNKQPEALKYYRKAYKAKPDNNRYRRAYYKKRHLMERYYAADWY